MSDTSIERIAGVLIGLTGLMLMLAFSLHFNSSPPAWTLLLLVAGALGRDGLCFFVGCASFVISVALFTAVALAGDQSFEKPPQLLGPR